MDLAGSLNKAIEIVKLNGSVAAEVGRDEQALKPGLLFVAAGGLAAVVGSFFSFRHGAGPGALIAVPVSAIVAFFIGVGVVHLVATIAFGAKGDFTSLLRAESHASIVGWARIIPLVGPVLLLWHFPVTVVILESVYGMPRNQAIATVAIVTGGFLLFGLIMMAALGALLFGAL